MAANTDLFKKGARKWVGQIGAAGVGDAVVTTVPLASATGLPTDTAIVAVIDRVDSSGTKTPSLEESVIGVVSGSNLVTCTRGAEGTAQAHLAGAVVEILITNKGWNDMVDGILVEHSQLGVHGKLAYASLNAPEGFLINGKIVPSVATDDLTIAIKGMDGNDPSATNPVYVRIGSTIRSITAALSVTKADATNWFNSGSSELATKEIDYFVYLGYNATDGVVVGFSRIPYATEYDDFSATTTNEKYCAISTITNAAAGDDYVNIGRFAATLSATATFLWTVPTFTNKNLIQRPIFDSRWLSYVPTLYGTTGTIGTFTCDPYTGKYCIDKRNVFVSCTMTCTNVGSWGGSVRNKLPFTNTGVPQEFLGGVALTATSFTSLDRWAGIDGNYINWLGASTLVWGAGGFLVDYKIKIEGSYPTA